jgi:phospholipase C
MGAIDEIRHIVVLMFENQSFDRLLGYLRLDDPTQHLDGVTGAESNPFAPPADRTPISVMKVSAPAAYVTDPSPGHDFEDVNQQLFGERGPRDGVRADNAGFVLNYSRQVGRDGRRLGDRGREIMQCLDPALLPVLTTLARTFVVCDRWFSSVPGPTWPNRFFVHAGTANGLLVTPETGAELASDFWGSPYDMRSIFENLMERGLSWTVYFDDYAQAFALRRLHPYVDRFQRFEQFARDVEHGTLPAYAFIEPRSFSAPGYPANDQHPPHHLLEGEKLLADVYDTLRADDALWRRSLLVVLYDEHGGFYDHVPPPPAVPPDGRRAAPSGFGFDRLGVRVPALLVSPWVGEGRVDHTTYDHTSLLATVKRMFGLPQFLTARDAAASTFEQNFLPQARTVALTDLGHLVSPPPVAATLEIGRLSPHQRSLMALAETIRGALTATPGVVEVQRHAEAFLAQPQGP